MSDFWKPSFLIKCDYFENATVNFFCNYLKTLPNSWSLLTTTYRKIRSVDFLNERHLYFTFKNCCVMRLTWPSHKFDTYTNPVPASFESDVTLILCVKVKKIVYIHQVHLLFKIWSLCKPRISNEIIRLFWLWSWRCRFPWRGNIAWQLSVFKPPFNDRFQSSFGPATQYFIQFFIIGESFLIVPTLGILVFHALIFVFQILNFSFALGCRVDGS